MTAKFTRRAMLALALAPMAARAHDGLHASGVEAVVDTAQRGPDGKLAASMTLTNGTGVAVTLRGVHCDTATSTHLLRRSSLFGVKSWSKVDLLRIDPGETLALIPPDYRIEITGAPPGEDLLNLRLDFGPAGEKTVVLFVAN